MAEQKRPMDSVPNPNFKLVVDDIFKIAGGKRVLLGVVEADPISVGDKVDLFDENAELIEEAIEVLALERAHKKEQTIDPGERVAVILKIELWGKLHKGCYILRTPEEEEAQEEKVKTTEEVVAQSDFKLVANAVFAIGGKKRVLVGTVENDFLAREDFVDLFDKNGELIEGSLPIVTLERAHKNENKVDPGDSVGVMIEPKLPAQACIGCYIVKGEEDAQKEPSPRYQYIAKGLCAHCGGIFKGAFSKKCISCGKPKDY